MSSRPRQYDLIAFDWDGTLFDSTAIITRSIQEAVRDVGGTVPSDRDASYVIGMALGQALAHAAPDVPPERYPALGERYRHHYTAHQNDLSLFSGVLELLADLKGRHHLLAVATGKSRRGLDEVLHTVALKGVEPKRTLMIGDTTHDLQMALNAGCCSVGVSYGAHEPEAFHALQPLHVAHSVRELHDWLLKNA
jgi:phosphoglycolate phosphatase